MIRSDSAGEIWRGGSSHPGYYLVSTTESYKLPIDSHCSLLIGLGRTDQPASQASSSTLVQSPRVRRENCYGIQVSITFPRLPPAFNPYKSAQKKARLYSTYSSMVLLELLRLSKGRRKSDLDRDLEGRFHASYLSTHLSIYLSSVVQYVQTPL